MLTVRIPVLGQTGFWVSDTVIVTCAHGACREIPIGTEIEIAGLTGPFRATVLIIDTDLDILVLRAANGATPAMHLLKLSDKVSTRESLYSWGYTSDYPEGESVGLTVEGWSEGPTQLKLAGGIVSPGMSGAPLVSESSGHIVGMLRVTRDRDIPAGGRGVPSSVIGELLAARKIAHNVRTLEDLELVEDGELTLVIQMFESAYHKITPRIPVDTKLRDYLTSGNGFSSRWGRLIATLDKRHDSERRNALERWYSINKRCVRFITRESGLGIKRIGATCVLPLTSTGYDAYRSGRLREFDLSSDHVMRLGADEPSAWICVQSFAVNERVTREIRSCLLYGLLKHVLDISNKAQEFNVVAEVGTYAGYRVARHFDLDQVAFSGDERPLFERTVRHSEVQDHVALQRNRAMSRS